LSKEKIEREKKVGCLLAGWSFVRRLFFLGGEVEGFSSSIGEKFLGEKEF
jgi:hypothetical protein